MSVDLRTVDWQSVFPASIDAILRKAAWSHQCSMSCPWCVCARSPTKERTGKSIHRYYSRLAKTLLASNLAEELAHLLLFASEFVPTTVGLIDYSTSAPAG
jgi:hypothetical protein